MQQSRTDMSGGRGRACALALALTACGGTAPPPAPVQPASPAADVVEANPTPLQAGDIVRLRIWREPDLSGEFIVNERDEVVLPKIGVVEVAAKPPAELAREIRAGFERFLRNPSIEIVLARRVNILGAVRMPGLYRVDPTMTVADALALAGGVLPNGRQDRVEVFRGEHRLITQINEGTRVGDLGLRSGDQLYVPERAWLDRNAGIIASVASTVIGATVSLIIAFSR